MITAPFDALVIPTDDVYRAGDGVIIFKPELVLLIQQGRKTMTRRPMNGECRYRVGHTYAVQSGRGRPASLRITIMDVRQERLDDISWRDAKREGFRTTQEFKDYWTTLYGRYDPEQSVWAIAFLKGDHTDQPRLLKARPGPPEGDYTSIPARAIHGEGECVPAAVTERYARDASDRPKAEQREKWREQRARLLAVLAELRTHALDRDVEKNLRVIERQVRSLDSKLRSVA